MVKGGATKVLFVAFIYLINQEFKDLQNNKLDKFNCGEKSTIQQSSKRWIAYGIQNQ